MMIIVRKVILLVVDDYSGRLDAQAQYNILFVNVFIITMMLMKVSTFHDDNCHVLSEVAF